MSKKDELQDLDLDDIMNEFHSEGDVTESDEDLDALLKEFGSGEVSPAAAVPPAPLAPAGVEPELPEFSFTGFSDPAEEPTRRLVNFDKGPAPRATDDDTRRISGEDMKSREPVRPVKKAEVDADDKPTHPLPTLDEISKAQKEAREKEKATVDSEATVRLADPTDGEAMPTVGGDTVRIDTPSAVTDRKEADASAMEDDTVRVEVKEDKPKSGPIVYDPRAKLRALKHDLIAGPEKRYYELSEQGTGRLQAAILINLIIVALCAGAITLHTMELVPENRVRFLVFSQVLAMLVSALLGSHQMMDGLSDLFRGKFTVNTLMTMTFVVCCVDAVFSLRDQRVPCCAGFCLEMTMALWARYERRATEMGQMDTLRKAIRLHGIVKSPDYYEGKDGLLRTDGRVSDFWGQYSQTTAPEKAQGVYAFVSFLLCIGIAVLAGLMHGVSLSIQVLAVSLLVAVPASFFVALTRPAAVLERRLHMVGTVLCGWKGTNDLGGPAAFPVTDADLFPKGSTKLNGVKFYSDRTPDQIVSYTASLILAAKGSLVPVFRQLLTSRGAAEHPVVNFRDYANGGVGGEVCGEPVLVGSMSFLRDMGVEIPEGTMVNQAVYAAIDGELVAVVAMAYAKMRSAAAGMVTLCGFRKLTTVITGDDFILTEGFLRSKFGINTKRLVFPGAEARKALAAKKPAEDAPCLALTTREELVSSAYAVTGARSLRRACWWGMGLHMFGGILGMLIMVVLTIINAAYLLTPANVLLWQLVWAIPGLLITEWTRNV